MTTGDTPGRATAVHLLRTAERLFAAHGIDGVPLRQVVAEAGSSNKSAVQYHFGSKAGLLAAIVSYRLADLLTRRSLLEARVAPGDVRGRFEAHALPLLELAESPDNAYVAFIDQLQRSHAADVLASHAEARRSHERFTADMRGLLAHIPEPARSLRIDHVRALMLHAAAERDRALRRGDAVVPFGVFVAAVVDGFTGFLTAPASDETLLLAAGAAIPDPLPRATTL